MGPVRSGGPVGHRRPPSWSTRRVVRGPGTSACAALSAVWTCGAVHGRFPRMTCGLVGSARPCEGPRVKRDGAPQRTTGGRRACCASARVCDPRLLDPYPATEPLAAPWPHLECLVGAPWRGSRGRAGDDAGTSRGCWFRPRTHPRPTRRPPSPVRGVWRVARAVGLSRRPALRRGCGRTGPGVPHRGRCRSPRRVSGVCGGRRRWLRPGGPNGRAPSSGAG